MLAVRLSIAAFVLVIAGSVVSTWQVLTARAENPAPTATALEGAHGACTDDATADTVQTECRRSCMIAPEHCSGKKCSQAWCPADKCAHCTCSYVVVPCTIHQSGPTCYDRKATCECQ